MASGAASSHATARGPEYQDVTVPMSDTVQAIRCPQGHAEYPPGSVEIRCPECQVGLDIGYDYTRVRESLSTTPVEARRCDLWRFPELLPTTPLPQDGSAAGVTPLRHARRLGEALGMGRLYIKDETLSSPSMSYKDRVVSVAIARALELGGQEIACVSTGNVGNAVAALAAQYGLKALIFYPHGLEPAKAAICRAFGATVVSVDGTYDEVNHACRDVSAERGLPFVNITLRPYYAEGAKTLAYEVAEALEWRAPDHIVLPVAGATLISRVDKGLTEMHLLGLTDHDDTRLHAAQPEGCSPVVSAILKGATGILPQRPNTVAHSLAIGAPADGPMAIRAVRRRQGWAASPTDAELLYGAELLAQTEGILAEPAGGTSVAAIPKLVSDGHIAPDDTVVAAVTGNAVKTLTAVRDTPPSRATLTRCDPAALGEAVDRARNRTELQQAAVYA